MKKAVEGFFAYPSHPISITEVMKGAIEEINCSPEIKIISWKECRVGGKIVIETLCRKIDQSDIFLADVTGINQNVMFELGYAIGKKKRIWIVLDVTLSESRKEYEQVQLLTTVGYASYRNSDDIARAFFLDRPYEDVEASIFASSIEPSLAPTNKPALLYLKNRHNIEASRMLDMHISKLQREGLPCVIDDPSESRVQALSWYAQKVYDAVGVIAHLCGAKREGSRLHNARYAFISGLAFGFGKPLLMLAEEDYPVPIDYHDMIRLYATGKECLKHTEPWLMDVTATYSRLQTQPRQHLAAIKLATELKSLRFGEHIAENEQDILDEYFVETSCYSEALAGRHTIFVGRKGSGKTANLIKIASVLGKDKRNLVAVVKPIGYEVDGVARLLKRYKERDIKGYLVESLWKFLLYTELAKTTAEWIEEKPEGHVPSSDEERLLGLLGGDGKSLREDFAVRLERAVEALCRVEEGETIEASRVAISEALHDGVLRNLRVVLGRILADRNRVAILVDNLDKGWDKGSDLPHLTDLLLGLLGVARRIPLEFAKTDKWRQAIRMSLMVFLRSDIFATIMEAAREPDKISYSRLKWDDPEMLLRVIEERFKAAHSRNADPDQLWSRYFCPTVHGRPTRQYLYERILPRPRDIVFLCNAAVAIAVNRGHACIEEDDIIDAEKQYSQYAFEMIQVENGITVPELEAVLYEFVGRPAVLPEDEVINMLNAAAIDAAKHQSVIEHLVQLSFLGQEVRHDEFVYSDEEEELRKNMVLARRLVEEHGGPRRYQVNAPFRSFLEISEP
jgi:hypothetical protein